MRLFLVKWEDGTSALVTAPDAEALVDVLDQLADPAAASWAEYDGPLWLEFPRLQDGLPEGDVDPSSLGMGRPEPAETDQGGEFVDELLRRLHPHVAALRDQALGEQRLIPRDELDRAADADLVIGLPGSVYGRAHGPEN